MTIKSKVAVINEAGPKVDPGQSLLENTFCVRVRLGRLGNTKKVQSSQVDVGENVDKDFTRTSKKLIESSAFEKIAKIDSKIKRYIYNDCLPYTEAGFALIPDSQLMIVETKLREWKLEREAAVEEFIEAYPRLCKEAAKHLGKLYAEGDYLPIDYVRSRFYFAWNYVSFGVPDKLRKISQQVFDEEKDKMSAMVVDAAQNVRDVMAQTFLELVAKLRDRLSDDKKSLRESYVQDLKDFIFTFDLKNVTNYTELEREVERAKKLLEGKSFDAIRNTDDLQRELQKGMSVIAANVDKLVANKPNRKFRADED